MRPKPNKPVTRGNKESWGAQTYRVELCGRVEGFCWGNSGKIRGVLLSGLHPLTLAHQGPRPSRCAGLRALDRHAANGILARAGLQLKSKATVSERKVAITLDDGRTVEHTLFWLATTTPAEVIGPEDADEDRAEASRSG
jgi:hypothetical protein